MDPIHYLIPIISLVIGWVTNRLAIEFLFRPKKKIPFGFFAIQGVLPRRRAFIAQKLTEAITKHFISQKDFAESFSVGDDQTDDELIAIIANKIDDFLQKEVSTVFPLASVFMTDDFKDQIKKAILVKAYEALPEMKIFLKERITKNFSIEKIVSERAKGLSFDELENVLKSVLNKELKFIELMGAVLGFFIGIIQVVLIINF